MSSRFFRQLEVADMEPRYSRNIPALSEEECTLLQTKRIAIIGCGGLGGHLIDLAARIGFGVIRAVDGDIFEESNLNRQLLCDCSQLGKSKAQAAAAHIHRVNPQISCEGIAVMLNADNAAELLAGCDLVFDALDSIESRRLLAYAAAASNLPVAYGAIRGWVAQAALYLPEEPLIDLLYPPDARLSDKSALAFTPALCAALQMSLAVKYLCGRPVSTGTLYYVDLLNMETATLPLR